MTLEDAIAVSGLDSGCTVSFHHHLRDGDAAMEMGLRACRTLGLRDLHLAASSLFPCHASLIPMLEDGTVSRITTAYMNGPLADFISAGNLQAPVTFTTHGGRARMIANDAPDLAIIAAPAVDPAGNIGGADGPWACGPLGYAMVDAAHARHRIAVTPHRTDTLSRVCISHMQIDAICKVSSIGDASQIESGTTARRPSAQGRATAALAVDVIRHAGVLRDGFRFQTGAGGVSLEVARLLAPLMAEANVTGAFAAGGITKAHVGMARAGLFHRIKNAQSFDAAAVQSYATDTMHDAISAHGYANPDNPDCIAHQLDVMILGAAQVDVDFNVNVTTTGDGRIIGGSGGHADTAEGADLSIVVVPSTTKGIPRIVDRVRCVSTSGSSIDVVVTERGVCVNPKRRDLAKDLRRAGLPVIDIQTVAQATPEGQKHGRVIAKIHDRRGNLTGEVRQGAS